MYCNHRRHFAGNKEIGPNCPALSIQSFVDINSLETADCGGLRNTPCDAGQRKKGGTSIATTQ